MKTHYATLLRLLGTRPGAVLVEIGAGEGHFLSLAAGSRNWSVHGCDVHEHAGLDGSRAQRVRTHLAGAGLDPDRYRWYSARAPLPFPDAFADCVVSCQTLEHVRDIDRLFAEIRRVLKPGGVALHHFPCRQVLVDPHCGVPLAHRAGRRRRGLLRLCALLGVGKYRRLYKPRGYSAERFAAEFDAYLGELCHYRGCGDYLRATRAAGLRPQLRAPPPLPGWPFLAPVSALFTSIYLWQRG